MRSQLPAARSVTAAHIVFSFVLLSVVFCCRHTAVLAQSKPNPTEPGDTQASPTPAPTPKSNVSGRVIYADTQRPLRRISVSLVSVVPGGAGGESSTATDEQGYFTFKNIAAGSYLVAVNAPGVVAPTSFLKWDSEQPNQEPDWSEARKNFTTFAVDGVNDVTAKVEAQRGGAVSGKIIYDNGDPALNVQIMLARKQGDTMQPVFTGFSMNSLARLRTDDRGQYRVAGLPAGEYIVSAVEANTDPGQGGSSDNDSVVSDALTRTYYGDTNSAKQATIVKVELGSEANGIDIRLADLALHTISGTLTARRDGRPIRETSLQLMPREKGYSGPFSSIQRYVQTDSEGVWSFKNVPDGAYYIVAEAPYEETPNSNGSGEPSYHRKLLRQQLEVTLAGSDQTSLLMQLKDGGSLSGVVVVEGSKRAKPEENYGVCLRAEKIKDPEHLWQPSELSGCAEENRKITLEGLPGGEFRVLPASLPENYYLKAITAKGVDLLKQPLTLAEGETVQDLQVVVAAGSARLTVRAQNATGGPLANAPLFVIPADTLRQGDANSYLRGLTDAGGTWAENCAPGEYLVFFPDLENAAQFTNPAYVKEHLAQGQRVTVQPNEKKTAELSAPR